MDKLDYERNLTKHEEPTEEMKESEEISTDCIVDQSKDKYLVKRIITDARIVHKDINDYAELCAELKMLYTAITRPRKTLIIYDQESGARKNL